MIPDKKITLTESELRRLVAMQAQSYAYERERAFQIAESEYRHRELMAQALAQGAWTIPGDELRRLMAQGKHHELCGKSRWMAGAACTCGIDYLAECDREVADEADERAGYGLI